MLVRFKNTIILLLGFFTLSACSMKDHASFYQNQQPAFNIEAFFEGDINVWGIVQNRQGKVIRRFKADIDASWQNLDDGRSQLTLDEHFVFNNGEKQQRIWKIVKTGDNQYQGQAGDVVGNASGRLHGNALHWKYDLLIPYNDGEITVHLDDWMWAMDSQVVINRTVMKKFGFRVGEITLFMQKVESN